MAWFVERANPKQYANVYTFLTMCEACLLMTGNSEMVMQNNKLHLGCLKPSSTNISVHLSATHGSIDACDSNSENSKCEQVTQVKLHKGSTRVSGN